jgi:hypothetical protein
VVPRVWNFDFFTVDDRKQQFAKREILGPGRKFRNRPADSMRISLLSEDFSKVDCSASIA